MTDLIQAHYIIFGIVCFYAGVGATGLLLCLGVMLRENNDVANTQRTPSEARLAAHAFE